MTSGDSIDFSADMYDYYGNVSPPPPPSGPGSGGTVTNTTGHPTTLQAPNANSIVTGGGYDVLSLAGPIANYSLRSNGDGTITLSTTGSSDLVSGVIQLAYTDKTITVAANGSGNEYVALLYQAALGRAPDGAGLAFWEQTAATTPANQAALSLAPNFTHSAEFVAKYGPLTDAQFVNQMYVNVLDRAADSGGLSFWTGQMAQGTTREQMLTAFAVSAEATQNATQGFIGQSGVHGAWLLLI
jgi:hypothetical protein